MIISVTDEAVSNVQCYKSLKAVWCCHVLNFLRLVVFQPSGRFDSPNHYKIKEFKKEGLKSRPERLLTSCQCYRRSSSLYCDLLILILLTT